MPFSNKENSLKTAKSSNSNSASAKVVKGATSGAHGHAPTYTSSSGSVAVVAPQRIPLKKQPFSSSGNVIAKPAQSKLQPAVFKTGGGGGGSNNIFSDSFNDNNIDDSAFNNESLFDILNATHSNDLDSLANKRRASGWETTRRLTLDKQKVRNRGWIFLRTLQPNTNWKTLYIIGNETCVYLCWCCPC